MVTHRTSKPIVAGGLNIAVGAVRLLALGTWILSILEFSSGFSMLQEVALVRLWAILLALSARLPGDSGRNIFLEKTQVASRSY